MIRHFVAFRFRPDVPEAERQRVLAELEAFPVHYPTMRRWALGRNISRRDDTFSHGFSVEFDSEMDLDAYLSSERHERFVRDVFRPAVEARAIVSFEVPSGAAGDAGEGRAAWGPPLPPARGMIFDMDGLLVDTGSSWRRIGDEVFAAAGVDVSPLTGRGLTMGMSLAEAATLLRTYAGLEEQQLPDIERRVEQAMVAAVRTEVHLKPGAREAIGFCRAHGLRTALASGSTAPIIDAVLERFGLSGCFDAVCSAADGVVGKPHPELFLRAASALGLTPAECVVVEDAVSGCIAGKAAGMRVVAVPDGPAVGDRRFAIADVELRSLEQLESPSVLALLGLREP